VLVSSFVPSAVYARLRADARARGGTGRPAGRSLMVTAPRGPLPWTLSLRSGATLSQRRNEDRGKKRPPQVELTMQGSFLRVTRTGVRSTRIRRALSIVGAFRSCMTGNPNSFHLSRTVRSGMARIAATSRAGSSRLEASRCSFLRCCALSATRLLGVAVLGCRLPLVVARGSQIPG
jgi:hypothetical protein